MLLDQYLEQLGKYRALAESVNLNSWTRWSGAVHLLRLIRNLREIAAVDEGFAMAAAAHKLRMLHGFSESPPEQTFLEQAFLDTYLGMHNLGMVANSTILRSSQPSTEDLLWLIREAGICTIINLRREKEIWGSFNEEEEMRTCLFNGAAYICFDLEDPEHALPTYEEIETILQYLDACPKPALIHCSDGAIRTGLVAAAYRLTRLLDGWEETLEYSIQFGLTPDLNSEQLELLRRFIPAGNNSAESGTVTSGSYKSEEPVRPWYLPVK